MIAFVAAVGIVVAIVANRPPHQIQPAAATYLQALTAEYGQTIELVGDPIDRTPELDESRNPGLAGRITAHTRGGQVRFEDYASIADRQNAQQRIVQWQTSSPPGAVPPAYASCKGALVVLTGYTDPAAEYQDVLAADQLLRSASGDNCGEEPTTTP